MALNSFFAKLMNQGPSSETTGAISLPTLQVTQQAPGTPQKIFLTLRKINFKLIIRPIWYAYITWETLSTKKTIMFYLYVYVIITWMS